MDITPRDTAITWLLKGDPAIRWQVGCDLLGWPPREWRAEQARVASEGSGVRLLARQDDAGRWTRRLYGQKWISTTYSIALLRQMGLPKDDPRARKTCRLFLDEALWCDGGINATASQERSETCLTGMVLGLLDRPSPEEAQTRRSLAAPRNRHPGRTFFELETVGMPSRWNTLRALRVLRWFEHGKAAAQQWNAPDA